MIGGRRVASFEEIGQTAVTWRGSRYEARTARFEAWTTFDRENRRALLDRARELDKQARHAFTALKQMSDHRASKGKRS